ncbi:MAG: hypothetical protein ACR2KJ_00155, partial [Jatrophihabitans sp.]
NPSGEREKKHPPLFLFASPLWLEPHPLTRTSRRETEQVYNDTPAERNETGSSLTVEEILDSVRGWLPLDLRRQATRPKVQASLKIIARRQGIAIAHSENRS